MKKLSAPYRVSKSLRKTDTLNRQCNVCSRSLSIILKANGHYRGGYYFGKVPKVSKAETNKALKGGTKPVRIGSHVFQVLKHDPKPYGHVEYWECDGCYTK